MNNNNNNNNNSIPLSLSPDHPSPALPTTDTGCSVKKEEINDYIYIYYSNGYKSIL